MCCSLACSATVSSLAAAAHWHDAGTATESLPGARASVTSLSTLAGGGRTVPWAGPTESGRVPDDAYCDRLVTRTRKPGQGRGRCTASSARAGCWTQRNLRLLQVPDSSPALLVQVRAAAVARTVTPGPSSRNTHGHCDAIRMCEQKQLFLYLFLYSFNIKTLENCGDRLKTWGCIFNGFRDLYSFRT